MARPSTASCSTAKPRTWARKCPTVQLELAPPSAGCVVFRAGAVAPHRCDSVIRLRAYLRTFGELKVEMWRLGVASVLRGVVNSWRLDMGNLDVASEALAKLSARAKEAETHAKAARDETKADLERDVSAARASSQAQAEKLRAKADASKGKISAGWAHLQRAWSEHIAKIRADIESKKTEHGSDEAEYAVLDAALARMDADELAAAGVGA